MEIAENVASHLSNEASPAAVVANVLDVASTSLATTPHAAAAAAPLVDNEAHQSPENNVSIEIQRTRSDTEDTDVIFERHRSLLEPETAEDLALPESNANAKISAAPREESDVALASNKNQLDVHSTISRRASLSVTSLFQTSVSNSICRHPIASKVILSPPRPPPQQQIQRWDGFVRGGTRLKTLLEDTVSEVTQSIRQKRRRDEDNDDHDNGEHRNPKNPRVVQVADFSVQLAREKTTENLQLKRQLKDAESQASAMQAANVALREETTTTQSRLDRTLEALRIAGSNAAKARADADAAEATAANLAQTLQSLQAVITETKRAAQILHDDQQQVTATASEAEAKLLQKEGDLSRAKKELSAIRQRNTMLENSHDDGKEERDRLEQQVQDFKHDLEDLKRKQLEQSAVEDARKERADKVEQQWRRAQTMLTEATSGQAASAETQSALQETISSMQKSNQELHVTLKEQQDTSRDETRRLSTALSKAEKEAQKLRISTEAAHEEIQRLKLDKSTADRENQQLKSRLSQAERNRKETPLTETTGNVSPEANELPSAAALSFHLPPLSRSSEKTPKVGSATVLEKENEKISKGLNCCICFKVVSGLMKTCQCGKADCKLRAHINCAKLSIPGPSISHPGTPAPMLPVVLCSSMSSKVLSRSVD